MTVMKRFHIDTYSQVSSRLFHIPEWYLSLELKDPVCSGLKWQKQEYCSGIYSLPPLAARQLVLLFGPFDSFSTEPLQTVKEQTHFYWLIFGSKIVIRV